MAAARPCKLLLAIAAASHATTWGGLRNQGNTCYMNSLLQVLYHVPEFRRAIYSLPTSTAAELGTSSRVVLELQRLFYRLQVQP